MPALSDILADPSYVNANAATKAAIFDKFSAGDENFTKANAATQLAIRTKFGAAPAPAPAADEKSAPTPKQSWGDVAVSAVGNAIPSTAKMVGGIAHAVAHPIDTASGTLDLLEGGARNLIAKSPTAKAALDWLDSVHVDPTVRDRAIATADAVGGIYKEKYGSEDGFKNALATDPASVAADFSALLGGAAGLARLTGKAATAAGATGAASALRAGASALATGASVTNPMTPVVAAATPVANLLAKGVGAIARPVMLGAKNNFLLNATEGRGQDVVNALRNPANVLVAGTAPTAGEMAAGVGATKFSAAQKAAEAVLPTEYFDRNAANRAAHQVALETVSGNPTQQAAAVASRELTSGALYGAVKSQTVPLDVTLNRILQRPAVQDALGAAEEISGNKGVGFNLRARQTSEITGRDPLTNAPVTPPQFSMGDLQNVKVALDKQIRGLATATGTEAARGGAILDAKNALVAWMDKNSPSYRVARGVYADQSGAINQMEVGQVLKSALENPIAPTERRGAFANAMDNAAGTVKKATGQSRFQKLDEVLTPKQVEAVNSVRADVERQALMDAQARAASSSAPNIQTPAGELIAQATGGAAIPGMLSRITMAANAIIKRLEGKIDHKLAIELASDMLDPAKTAKAVSVALKRQAELASRGAAIRSEGAAIGNTLKSQRA